MSKYLAHRHATSPGDIAAMSACARDNGQRWAPGKALYGVVVALYLGFLAAMTIG